jgi:hypothetical protein
VFIPYPDLATSSLELRVKIGCAPKKAWLLDPYPRKQSVEEFTETTLLFKSPP